jgi:hypothetical protein
LLHESLASNAATLDGLLMLIRLCEPALQVKDLHGNLPIHVECKKHCRISIISACFERYPQLLSRRDGDGYLQLDLLLLNRSSSIVDALTLFDRYPLALGYQNGYHSFPLHQECAYRCRPPVILKYMELCPKAFDEKAMIVIMTKVNKRNFRAYAATLSIIFAASPMSLYPTNPSRTDKRLDPYYRRRILHLLPRHVFTATHELDYRDLNWQSRTVMMILLSRLKRGSKRHGALPANYAAPVQLVDVEDNDASRFRYLLLSIIEKSSLLSNADQPINNDLSAVRTIGLCQHDDPGDIWLRMIIGFL